MDAKEEEKIKVDRTAELKAELKAHIKLLTNPIYEKLKKSWWGNVIIAISKLVFITTAIPLIIIFKILKSGDFMLAAIAAMLYYYLFLQ